MDQDSLTMRMCKAIVILFMVCSSVSTTETHYVEPLCTSSDCLTLSQYATNSSSDFSPDNITLALEPGNHILNSTLSISNIAHLSLTANGSSLQDTTVTCSHSGKFQFESIVQVSVSNITFLGCINNEIRSVIQLSISNCVFDGQGRDGTGLDMHGVASAIIEHTSFTDNTGRNITHPLRPERFTVYGGAMIINDSSVSISYSHFSENRAEIGGGIFCWNGYLEIRNSTYFNNSCFKYGGAVSAASSVTIINSCEFFNNKVTSDHRLTFGGAIIILFSNGSTIANCRFANNTANTSGGAIDLFETAQENEVMNCEFVFNSATTGSAITVNNAILKTSGLNIHHNQHGTIFAFNCRLLFSGTTTIANNTYTNSSNLHGDGGALISFRSEVNFTGTTDISFNKARQGGAISATESRLNFNGDVSIAYNNASMTGGGIFLFLSETNVWNHSVLTGNTAVEKGGGIHAVDSSTSLYTEGSLTFVVNAASKGGGMCLELNAKLFVVKVETECSSGSISRKCNVTDPRKYIRLEFNNNSADYGGAFFVSDSTTSGTCKAVPFRSQSTAGECFLQGLALHAEFLDQNLILRNVFFYNNSARIAGKTLYGGLLDRCTVSQFAEIFRIPLYRGLNPSAVDAITYFLILTNITKEELQSEISSDPVRVCFCKNNQPNCSYQPLEMVVRKGGTVNVSLVAVDQVNNTVPNVNIQSSIISQAESDESCSKMYTNDANCTVVPNIIYTSNSSQTASQLSLHPTGPCKDSEASKRSVDISIIPCPIGFQDTGELCMCHPDLHPEFVTGCSIDNGSVLVKQSVWISAESEQMSVVYITHSNCPFDYCKPRPVSVNLNVSNGPDAQCAFNRSGILCGSCMEGLSLSLGNSHCTQCTNSSLALIIVFALAGVVLLAFLLFCNLTVAVGTINGAIFYANIIGANSAIFFPFVTPNILTVFIAWLNLDFGFETCFYNGMDGYAKTWLQFVFPVYILLLVFVVIIACKYYSRLANFLASRNPVATLATLILLSYAKLLRAVIAAFSSATLKEHSSETGDIKSLVVWRVDGNIGYLKGKHIPLFIFAFLVLVVGLAYTLFLLLWQWLQLLPSKRYLHWIRNTKLNSFMDAYVAPYNRQYRFWTGLLLLTRGVLFLVAAISSNPRITLIAIACATILLSLLKALIKEHIYKTWLLNTLENLFIFNLAIFSTATLYVKETGGNQTALACTSMALAFITFLGILVYHTLTTFRPIKLVAEKIKLTDETKIKVYLHKVEEFTSSVTAKPLTSRQTNQPMNRLQDTEEDKEHSTKLRDSVLGDEDPSVDINFGIESTEFSTPTPQGVTYSEIDGIPKDEDN